MRNFNSNHENITWRHENTGIIRFYVHYVMIVNNNKRKSFIFVYTPDILSRASLHTRYRKILIVYNNINIHLIVIIYNLTFDYLS